MHLNYLRGLSIVTNQWLVYIENIPVRPIPTAQNVFHFMFWGGNFRQICVRPLPEGWRQPLPGAVQNVSHEQ